MKTFNEWIEDNTIPSFFRSTQYRLPTEEELDEFKDYPDLTSGLILDKFKYVIIGRGMNSEANKQKIIDSIGMLVARYPDNLVYREALEKAKL